MSATCRILHLVGNAEPSDSQARMVQLINAFGGRCAHSIVWGATDTRIGIDRGIAIEPAIDFPPLLGHRTPGRLQRLARAMQGYDLVLTYGYGAIDAAMAQTLYGGYLPLPPLVHHEDAASAPNTAQDWYRRIALGRAAALIVPTPRLAAIAVNHWHQPRWRVQRIPLGIRTAAFANPPRRDILPRVIKRAGELWLGTLADQTPAEALTALVRSLSALPQRWQLVVVGEHRQRAAISDEALRLDLSHRLHWTGAVAEPGKAMAAFDVLVLAADRAPSLTLIIHAMAAGLAVVSRDVDDVAAVLAPENRPFIVAPADAAGLGAALRTIAEDSALRARVGVANRALARAQYDEAAMVAAYRAVYAAALGQDSFP